MVQLVGHCGQSPEPWAPFPPDTAWKDSCEGPRATSQATFVLTGPLNPEGQQGRSGASLHNTGSQWTALAFPAPSHGHCHSCQNAGLQWSLSASAFAQATMLLLVMALHTVLVPRLGPSRSLLAGAAHRVLCHPVPSAWPEPRESPSPLGLPSLSRQLTGP